MECREATGGHTYVSGVACLLVSRASGEFYLRRMTRTLRSTQFSATSSGPSAAVSPGLASAAAGSAAGALAVLGPRQAGRVQVVPFVTLFPQKLRPVFLSFRSTQLAAMSSGPGAAAAAAAGTAAGVVTAGFGAAAFRAGIFGAAGAAAVVSTGAARQAGRVQVVPFVTLFPQKLRPVFLSFRSTQLAAMSSGPGAAAAEADVGFTAAALAFGAAGAIDAAPLVGETRHAGCVHVVPFVTLFPQ